MQKIIVYKISIDEVMGCFTVPYSNALGRNFCKSTKFLTECHNSIEKKFCFLKFSKFLKNPFHMSEI